MTAEKSSSQVAAEAFEKAAKATSEIPGFAFMASLLAAVDTFNRSRPGNDMRIYDVYNKSLVVLPKEFEGKEVYHASFGKGDAAGLFFFIQEKAGVAEIVFANEVTKKPLLRKGVNHGGTTTMAATEALDYILKKAFLCQSAYEAGTILQRLAEERGKLTPALA